MPWWCMVWSLGLSTVDLEIDSEWSPTIDWNLNIWWFSAKHTVWSVWNQNNVVYGLNFKLEIDPVSDQTKDWNLNIWWFSAKHTVLSVWNQNNVVDFPEFTTSLCHVLLFKSKFYQFSFLNSHIDTFWIGFWNCSDSVVFFCFLFD